MRIPRITLVEEVESRQQERGGALTMETVRDAMLQNPALTPEEAAFLLSKRYPQIAYEDHLKATRLIKRCREIVEKNETEHGEVKND